MNDILPFKVGDRVRVLRAYAEQAPASPLMNAPVLIVTEPGEYRKRGEVPIAFDGDIYYVPAEYVRRGR